jgi:hypothetical protein
VPGGEHVVGAVAGECVRHRQFHVAWSAQQAAGQRRGQGAGRAGGGGGRRSAGPILGVTSGALCPLQNQTSP